MKFKVGDVLAIEKESELVKNFGWSETTLIMFIGTIKNNKIDSEKYTIMYIKPIESKEFDGSYRTDYVIDNNFTLIGNSKLANILYK